MKWIILFPLICCAVVAVGQQTGADSVQALPPVEVSAYVSKKPLINVPASIGLISRNDLERFNNVSFLPALNTVPGVRMEERSPGSYRFSIRGSLLRSPFGVRNVKFYYNGVPFTDGGGNTYFNLFDLSFVDRMEVIKGPAGSLYGAGTGGVVLLFSPTVRRDEVEVSSVVGSYGLRRLQGSLQVKKTRSNFRFNYARQQAEGFREQAAMRRDAVSAEWLMRVGTGTTLHLNVLYTDLKYETPGGLTAAEAALDPSQARPAAGQSRSAEEQQATIYNKSPFASLMVEREWDARWTSRLAVFGSWSDFANPSIRNYETRDERNAGVRNENSFRFGKERVTGVWTTGVEGQLFFSTIAVHENEGGVKSMIQTRDRLSSTSSTVFTQVDVNLPLNFSVTGGLSANFSSVEFEREVPGVLAESRRFDPILLPRVALLNKITPSISVFVSASKGFSPPTIAELFPSRQIFDGSIAAERGTNIEVGTRSEKLFHFFSFDVVAYQFKLTDALVIRRDASRPGEPEYFVNAGGTRQRGVEAVVRFDVPLGEQSLFQQLSFWNSFAGSDYAFENYRQGDEDYSGNAVAGIPRIVNTTGLDVMTAQQLYMNATFSFVDSMPLDDANSASAEAYSLFNIRLGYKPSFMHRYGVDVFLGANNILDASYSLGNDLNAFGGRYFNPAAPRNYFAGMRINFSKS